MRIYGYLMTGNGPLDFLLIQLYLGVNLGLLSFDDFIHFLSVP